VKNTYPELNDRARGWLHFLWEKAGTEDDWSSSGEPHPWWDRYSTPPMTNFPRFDLADSCYAVALMADKTPAWREAYSQILDQMVDRHTTFWAAVDWLTQFGSDPDRDKYPDVWKGTLIPEHLWGRYDSPGWTANGVEPWGLQKDPVGADGMLFFKGFFNLVMSLHRYVSGDRKWDDPFKVAGVDDTHFQWTHSRVAEHLTEQWRRHPEGPHCENTKIWPYCLSAAGLGLQMFDRLVGTDKHSVFDEWADYAKRHYLEVEDGLLKWVALYYDPIVDHIHKVGSGGGTGVAWYALPQHPELAELFYRASLSATGWDDPAVPVAVPSDPRGLVMTAMLANEFGDAVTHARLSDTLEQLAEPRYFGSESEHFGYWFHLGEPWPRGQMSASLMVTDVADPGDWQRLFISPNLAKFEQPTVEGIEFPRLGLSQAWNDLAHGMLQVTTYAVKPSLAGEKTAFRVTGMPDQKDSIFVRCDGSEYTNWKSVGSDTIEIRTEIGPHSFQIYTGYRESTVDVDQRTRTKAVQSESRHSNASVSGIIRAGSFNGLASCPCCN